MRILSIQPVITGMAMHPFYGGKDVGCCRIAEACLKAGHEYFIMPPSEPQEAFFTRAMHRFGDRGHYATVLPNRSPKLLNRPAAGVATIDNPEHFRVCLKENVADVKPDIIHCHYNRTELASAINRVTFKGSRVCTQYSTGVAKKLNLYDHVICLSDEQSRDVLKAHPSLKNKITLIGHDLGDEFMEPLGPAPGKSVLWAGTMRGNAAKRKGLDILLQAYKCSPALNSTPLIVSGDGPGRKELESYAVKNNLNVTFRGWRTHEELASDMRNAFVFCMPSRNEGLGYVYVEALASGLPIVGFPRSVNSLSNELGIDVGLPFETRKESPDELADKLLSILMDNDCWSRNRLNLAACTRAAYAPWSNAAKTIELYQRLTGG